MEKHKTLRRLNLRKQVGGHLLSGKSEYPSPAREIDTLVPAKRVIVKSFAILFAVSVIQCERQLFGAAGMPQAFPE